MNQVYESINKSLRRPFDEQKDKYFDFATGLERSPASIVSVLNRAGFKGVTVSPDKKAVRVPQKDFVNARRMMKRSGLIKEDEFVEAKVDDAAKAYLDAFRKAGMKPKSAAISGNGKDISIELGFDYSTEKWYDDKKAFSIVNDFKKKYPGIRFSIVADTSGGGVKHIK